MNKASQWFYGGLTGILISLATTTTLLVQNANPQRNLPSEYKEIRLQLQQAAQSLRSFPSQSSEYQAQRKQLENLQERYSNIVAQPQIRKALEQDLERGLQIASAIGLNITFSLASMFAAYHGVRLRKRSYIPQ